MRANAPCAVLIVAILFCSVRSLSAAAVPAPQHSPVSIDTLFGWNGASREGRFTPVTVSVENPGPAQSVEFSLDIAWGSAVRGTRGMRRITQVVQLSSGATRRLPFVIPLGADPRSLTVSVSAAGATLGTERIDLHGLASPESLVVAISSDLAFDSLAGLSPSRARVVYPRIDDLPEAWVGYDGVDLVIVHDTSSRRMASRQVEALTDWVAAGGTVVFSGGAAALQHASAGLSRLLPVEVTGLRERTGLAPLAAFAGTKGAPQGTALAAEARVIGGSALADAGGLPLVVRRTLGKGTIWYLAIDPSLPPFATWEGALPFWRVLAGEASHPLMEPDNRGLPDDARLKVMLGSPPAALPSVLVGIAFALGYVLLFALSAGMSARLLPPKLRTLLLVGLPVIGCLCAWLVFDRILMPAEPRIVSAARVSLRSGDGRAAVTERIGLIASRPGTVVLSLHSRQAAVDEAEADPSARGLTLVEGDRSRAIDVPLTRFGARVIVVNDVIPFRVEARLEEEGTTVRVLVSNGTPRALLDCFLWRNGRGYPIGDVAAGAAETRTFQRGDGWDPRDPGGRDSPLPDARRAGLWGVEMQGEGAQPLLVGWCDGPALPLAVDGATPPAGRPPISLVMVELP